MSDQPRYYITTAISYPNGPPHIGHAYEVIATDAIARFMRLDGYDVFFLTGTDEHGQKIQQTAAQGGHHAAGAGRPQRAALPRHGRAAELLERRFHPHHRGAPPPLVGGNLAADGEERRHLSRQIRRLVLGARRGLLRRGRDPSRTSTRSASSSKTGTPVEWVEEESYFFKLSAYQQKLLDLYARDPNYVLPKERLNEVASFVRGGLQDLSISRTTFDWGIRVPGNPKHIMYVWVDALTNYITAAGFPDTDSAKFKRYWPADLHVIGKDIVRFHAVYWPAFLMSAGIEVPRRIFSHGFLFNRGEKMSKSVGNVIDPFTMADTYGVDQFRYFFLREVPFGQDGNYSHEAIVNRINADLANDLGNLAQRSLTMINKQLGGVLPKPGAFSDNDKAILAAADDMIGSGARAHEDAAASPGAQRGLGRGRRRQPLFRRRGALGAGQDRSGAAGHGALRHGRGAPAGRASCASRSCRHRPASCSICSALPAGRSGSSPRSAARRTARARAQRCRRPRRCSRATSSRKPRKA